MFRGHVRVARGVLQQSLESRPRSRSSIFRGEREIQDRKSRDFKIYKSRECQESEAHKAWGFIVHECRDFEAPFKLKWYNPHVIGLPTNASKWNDYRLKRSTRIQGNDHHVKEAVDDLSYDGNCDLLSSCCCKHRATTFQRKKMLWENKKKFCPITGVCRSKTCSLWKIMVPLIDEYLKF